MKKFESKCPLANPELLSKCPYLMDLFQQHEDKTQNFPQTTQYKLVENSEEFQVYKIIFPSHIVTSFDPNLGRDVNLIRDTKITFQGKVLLVNYSYSTHSAEQVFVQKEIFTRGVICGKCVHRYFDDNMIVVRVNFTQEESYEMTDL